jgi:RHS repeat-associated protein
VILPEPNRWARQNPRSSPVTRYPAPTRTDSYDYDAAGNTTTRDIGNADQTLSWDIEGHLATTTDSTGSTSYAYDANDSRLLRRDPTSTTVYLPNMELRLDKTTGTVAGTRYYDHGGSLIAVNTGGTIQFQAADPHGTAELSINGTTQALTQRRFTPFGQFRGSPTGIWPTDKGFVGGTIDPSGLTTLGARQYDPNTGRFISVDPIFDAKDPQSWNGYSYADNNPTTGSDPSGLDGPLRGNPDCYYANKGCDSGGKSPSGPRRDDPSPPVRHSCNWLCHTLNVGNAVVDEVADPFVSFYGQMPRNVAGGSAALACAEHVQAACGMAAQYPPGPPPDTHIPLGGDTSSPEYKITRLIVRYAPVVVGGVGAAKAGARVGLRAGLRAGMEAGARAGEEEVAASPSVNFVSKGAGLDLRRTAEIDGETWRFNTGHGFNRAHEGPSGMNDLRTTTLTADQIETAIARDVNAFRASGGQIPVPGTSGFRGPLERYVDVGGAKIGYRVTNTPDGAFNVPTYWNHSWG